MVVQADRFSSCRQVLVMQTDRSRQTGPHHAGGLQRLGDVSGVRLAPEHVALEARRPPVGDHREGVAVVADAKEGQVTHLTLP